MSYIGSLIILLFPGLLAAVIHNKIRKKVSSDTILFKWIAYGITIDWLLCFAKFIRGWGGVTVADSFNTVTNMVKYLPVAIFLGCALPMIFRRAQGISLKELWDDKRKYKTRFLTALPICSSLFFLATVFSSSELFFANIADLMFSYFDLIFPEIMLFTAMSLCFTALLSWLRGRLFDIAVTLTFGLTISAYTQYMFLNIDLGLFDGKPINWEQYNLQSAINLLLWIGFFALLFFLVKRYKINFMKFTAAALIAVQFIATFSLVITADKEAFERRFSAFSGADQFKVSSNENTIVIILDQMSNHDVDAALVEYPDMLKNFNDFTYYNNMDCSYTNTFPSIVHMLTGTGYNNEGTIDEFFYTAWGTEKVERLFSAFKEKNYLVNLFDWGDAIYLGPNRLYENKFSNNVDMKSEIQVSRGGILRKSAKISAYRCAPMVLKRYFKMQSNEFSSCITIPNSNMCKHNWEFYNRMHSEGVVADSNANYFIMQHIEGAHYYHHTTEDCKYSDAETTIEQTTKGCFLMVEEYINHLKRLGVYDKANIIVTSDHGTYEPNALQSFCIVKLAKEKRASLKVSEAPISEDDLFPTFLYLMGEEYSDCGRTIFDIGENEARERTLRRPYWSFDNYPPSHKYRSKGNSSLFNILQAYTYVGDRTDLERVVKNGNATVEYLKESIY